MSITPARVTGVVLSTSERSIVRKSDQKKFTFRDASVLMCNRGIVDVGFGDLDRLPIDGELVDVLVEVSVYNNDARFRYLEAFPAEAAVKPGARVTP